MANLTADRNALRQDGVLISMPLAAVKVFKGSLLANNTSGYVTKAADTANFTLAGIAYEQVDNSAGAAGDKSVRVERKGVFELNFSGTATQATVGLPVCMVDDNTVALAATTTNDVLVGRVASFVTATKVRVELSAV
ncbi:hypothetical protein [Pseudarthrobacter sp. fls2-241-R2A-168]|uniref:hypothetical protein n=1 Tax=Pseudarthrobacter sp. fls2-241-R2A-168 TaxID=3040304 RepID=UPI002554980D|nr:hypothetical protein [Pseudarthrobacter sp. fls2-241-R2A-168]